MPRRIALVVALVVTAVVGFALLAIAANGSDSGEANTLSAGATAEVAETATPDEYTESSDSTATIPTSSPGDDHHGWEQDDESGEHEGLEVGEHGEEGWKDEHGAHGH